MQSNVKKEIQTKKVSKNGITVGTQVLLLLLSYLEGKSASDQGQQQLWASVIDHLGEP